MPYSLWVTAENHQGIKEDCENMYKQLPRIDKPRVDGLFGQFCSRLDYKLSQKVSELLVRDDFSDEQLEIVAARIGLHFWKTSAADTARHKKNYPSLTHPHTLWVGFRVQIEPSKSIFRRKPIIKVTTKAASKMTYR